MPRIGNANKFYFFLAFIPLIILYLSDSIATIENCRMNAFTSSQTIFPLLFAAFTFHMNSLTQIDIFHSHIYSFSLTIPFHISIFSLYCNLNRIFYPEKKEKRKEDSHMWKVIHLFSFTLSKHNKHNPIRLYLPMITI